MANNLQPMFRLPQSHLLLLLLLLWPFLLEAADPLYHFCGSTGNYTANSTYAVNLSSLLGSISSDNSGTNGFYNLSSGQRPDQVNGIALCRGDVSPSDCQACLKNSSVEITQKCPAEKEAVIWYDNCMLRYSNRAIFGVVDWVHVFIMWNMNNVTSVTEFNLVMKELMGELSNRAAAGNSTLKFAAGNKAGPDSKTIYGLAQCTPDLSELDCKRCLTKAINDTSLCCTGRLGGRVVGPNCNIRYEVNRFYNPSAEVAGAPMVPPPASPPNSSTKVTGRPAPPPDNGNSNSLLSIMGPGGILVHHVIAFCSCITALVVLKLL